MSQALSQDNSLSGFKISGIHPFNPDISKEEQFMCSAVANRNLSNTDELPIPVHFRTVKLNLDPLLDLFQPNSSGNPSESFLSLLHTKANPFINVYGYERNMMII